MLGLKQFRRRQLFNFTLTELILLILFILLLFLWFKNVDLEKKNIICEVDKEQCQTALEGFQKKTGVLLSDDLPPDFEECSLSIRDRNQKERELLRKITELEFQLKKLNQELQKFKDKTGVNKAEDVPDKNKELIDVINKLKAENEIFKKKINELQDEINKLNKENQSLLAELDKANEGLEQCKKENQKLKGEGVGLPPCWPKGWKEGFSLNEDIDQGEYIFTIRLTEEGILVEEDYPQEIFNNQYKQLATNSLVLNQPLSIERFNLSMKGILNQSDKIIDENNPNITLARECRHWVRLFDETAVDNKILYKNLRKAVTNHFRIYEWKDDTYTDYKNKYKNLINE